MIQLHLGMEPQEKVAKIIYFSRHIFNFVFLLQLLVVYRVTNKASGQVFACKIIRKNSDMNDLQSMTTEIGNLKSSSITILTCEHEKLMLANNVL